MEKLSIEIHETKNFSAKEREKFNHAIEKATHVLNSEEFKTRFLALKLDQTNGMTNGMVYQKLISGSDNFNKAEDKDLDVYITLYYSFKNVVGATYPSTWWTWTNRKFFSRFNHASIGGHVIHEYMHNMGFGHKSPRDHDSVPYAVGYLVREMILEMEAYGRHLKPDQGSTPTPVVKKPTQKKTPLGWLKTKWINVKLLFKRLF